METVTDKKITSSLVHEHSLRWGFRDVYVVPPRESFHLDFYWLLLTAAYGLVNANAKWQHRSDECLRSIGFSQLVYIPQLFYKQVHGKLCMLAVMVVDDILLAGDRMLLKKVVDQLSVKYKIGTIVFGPRSFSFYGLNIIQNDDGSTQIHGDEKLNQLEANPIGRLGRKDSDDPLNAIELLSFGAPNGSLGFIGTAASPFCSFATSFLQQRRANPLVKDMVCQINMLREVKRRRTTITFIRPSDNEPYELNILVFPDAGRLQDTDNGQLGFIAGLVVGNTGKNAIFHTLSRTSHKSRRPVRSIGAAEILAAGSDIDEGKVLAQAYKTVLHMNVDLTIAVDSKDLFNSLSTCRNATDRSIRGDVNIIRHDFETNRISRMIWIPGNMNPADPLTETNSPLSQVLQVMMFSGTIPIDFNNSEQRNSVQFLE